MVPLRVLVVDDDIDFADGLAEVLEQSGHAVSVVYKAEAAIKAIDDQAFHLALVDVRMPEMNGVECLFEMKEKRPDMGVMLMTAHSAEELLQKAIEGGAVGTLRKPFDLSEFLAVLGKWGESSL